MRIVDNKLTINTTLPSGNSSLRHQGCAIFNLNNVEIVAKS
jgi:hypothetical protein